MTEIKSLTPEEIARQLGGPAYRARQLFRQLHVNQAFSFDEMTDLPREMRDKLTREVRLEPVKIRQKQVSHLDGTVKYLFELSDGECIETVKMRYRHGTSLCISTQAGCRMGCRFCASAIGGLSRNLTPAEMLDQVYLAQTDGDESVSHVVLMGTGEPLDNLDNVLRFLELLCHPDGQNKSMRNITLSTCGLVDQIDRLAEKRLQLTLSVSLHAADDASRREIMPVAKRWDLKALTDACRRYFRATGRRVSYEYALMRGVNDRDADAGALGRLLKGQGAHLNLIPVNEVTQSGFRRPDPTEIGRFRAAVERHDITVTVRRELGSDISAACGQLRNRQAKGEEGVYYGGPCV